MKAEEARQRVAEYKAQQLIEYEELGATAINKVYEEIAIAAKGGNIYTVIHVRPEIIIGTSHEQRLLNDGYQVSSQGITHIFVSWHAWELPQQTEQPEEPEHPEPRPPFWKTLLADRNVQWMLVALLFIGWTLFLLSLPCR